MKKILSLLVVAMMAAGVYAQTATVTDTIKAVAAQESDTNPGVVTILWQADSTISPNYVLYIYAADITTYQLTPIVNIAAAAKAFAHPTQAGLFGIPSNTVLTYGMNYKKLQEATGIAQTTIDAHKAGWEASVDETDLTLNAGYYYFVVLGVDDDFNTTEAQKAYLLKVNGKSQGVENVFESAKPVKFIDPSGQVRILRDGKTYDMSGTLVR